ncbi:MAG TPA: DUF6580 family putative transport protein [Gammaproteobacteria bacterium]|nr:DUF6580 family putative transport protein [Gammaproteobacteria bacterium]
MFKPRHEVLVAMVLAAALTRLIPHPPNMTSIGALALFGGAQFSDKRAAFLVPFAALLLSDLFLGLYSHMELVYGSFALIVCIGLRLRRRRNPWRIAGASLAGSMLFFVTTNFGVWAFGSMYPKDWGGLRACYTAAIPFFGNTLLGDGIYTLVLFGGFALLEKRFEILREAETPSPGTA